MCVKKTNGKINFAKVKEQTILAVQKKSLSVETCLPFQTKYSAGPPCELTVVWTLPGWAEMESALTMQASAMAQQKPQP